MHQRICASVVANFTNPIAANIGTRLIIKIINYREIRKVVIIDGEKLLKNVMIADVCSSGGGDEKEGE